MENWFSRFIPFSLWIYADFWQFFFLNLNVKLNFKEEEEEMKLKWKKEFDWRFLDQSEPSAYAAGTGHFPPFTCSIITTRVPFPATRVFATRVFATRVRIPATRVFATRVSFFCYSSICYSSTYSCYSSIFFLLLEYLLGTWHSFFRKWRKMWKNWPKNKIKRGKKGEQGSIGDWPKMRWSFASVWKA